MSQESMRTKISRDIEVRQIAQKWKLSKVTESTTIARTLVREAITLEIRQGVLAYWHSMKVEKKYHRVPPGNFTSDIHLTGGYLRCADTGQSLQRPGRMAYPLASPSYI